MPKKIFFILLFIFFLGGLVRFWRLGEIPTGLHRDEAFLGYNAYSLLKTGRDMSGNFLPLHLQSFLYSPTGYSYFSLPFIAVFDLNAFSVRFASAIFGTATILVAFGLTLSLFKKYDLALTSAFFLAISPWHINLSRTATENTIVVFFISLGVLFYLRWRNKTSLLNLCLSFLAFAITLALYQAPRAFLPIFIPFAAITLGVPKRQWLPLSALYFITIIVPLIFILVSPQLSLRIKTVSIFADTGTQLALDEQIREDGVERTARMITRIFHNKITGYNEEFLENYFSHFTYDFLFTDKGFPNRYRIAGVGLLNLFELPLILLGLYCLLRRPQRESWFILGWVVMAPIGSALTSDDIPNLQRTLLVFPALSMILATGAACVLKLDSPRNILNRLIKTGKIAIVLMGIYNLAFYLHQYYVHEPLHRPWFRHEGYQELVSDVNTLLPKYKKAIITTRESAPTIFFLFFGKYDPRTFQRETRSEKPRDLDRINFANYEFSQDECPLRLDTKIDPKTGLATKRFTGVPKVLYVNFGTCKTPTDYATELGQIKRGDNSVVFTLTTQK